MKNDDRTTKIYSFIEINRPKVFSFKWSYNGCEFSQNFLWISRISFPMEPNTQYIKLYIRFGNCVFIYLHHIQSNFHVKTNRYRQISHCIKIKPEYWATPRFASQSICMCMYACNICKHRTKRSKSFYHCYIAILCRHCSCPSLNCIDMWVCRSYRNGSIKFWFLLKVIQYTQSTKAK